MNMLSLLALVAGFALLVWGADRFVGAAAQLALRLGVPSLAVGLTVVALGTSAPEAAIAVTSSFNATDGMTIANVLGSNTMNTLVILGLVALFHEIPVTRRTLHREIPLVCLATGLLMVLCTADGVFGRADALLFLAILVVYLIHLARGAREKGMDAPVAAATTDTPVWRLALRGTTGAAAIAWGADLALDGASAVALALGMSERMCALTVVALGTSLPELVTSLTAARKGQADLAVGNVVGSSILNLLFVLGLSGTITPITSSPELMLDATVALAATALVWALAYRSRSLGRKGGLTLLAGYGIYLAHLVLG